MAAPSLSRRLNTFDATLIVMGGIIGSAIFVTPATVAQRVHSSSLILGAWAFGGLIALIGGFIFAELAWRRPELGGLYAYVRDAFHPVVAFMYGWTALLVSQSGGMAAAAVTFALYFGPLTRLHAPSWEVATAMLVVFSAINCLGVREGGNTQNLFMLAKIVAIVAIVAVGFFVAPAAPLAALPLAHPPTTQLLALFGTALIPVLFAYDGWQTASFMSAELKDPMRSLQRGMAWGVIAVIALYLAINVACVRVLGPAGLAATNTPASDIARIALGRVGEGTVSAVVAISTLGFLSNQILVSPRIYYAMAHDGLFFKQIAWLHPKTRAPIVAIALQGVIAMVIALSGKYDKILNYVTCIDFIFFALAAAALFVFRARAARAQTPATGIRVPGHPWSTAFFCVVSIAVVIDTCVVFPSDTLIGIGILISAVPVYYIWRRFTAQSGNNVPAR